MHRERREGPYNGGKELAGKLLLSQWSQSKAVLRVNPSNRRSSDYQRGPSPGGNVASTSQALVSSVNFDHEVGQDCWLEFSYDVAMICAPPVDTDRRGQATNAKSALGQVHAILRCLVLQAVQVECRRLRRRRGWRSMLWTVTGAHHPLAFIKQALHQQMHAIGAVSKSNSAKTR